MNRLLRYVLLLCVFGVCAPSWSQGSWNPDYNGDGIITATDLTGFLTSWEMSVDSIVKSAWEVHCDDMMEGLVPLDSVELTLAAMDIQLREDSTGEMVLDTCLLYTSPSPRD